MLKTFNFWAKMTILKCQYKPVVLSLDYSYKWHYKSFISVRLESRRWARSRGGGGGSGGSEDPPPFRRPPPLGPKAP